MRGQHTGQRRSRHFRAARLRKTTVARCIAGLERLPTGICVIDGEVWQDETTFRPPHLRPIGYVFKESCLFPHLSIRRNLLDAAPKPKPRPIAFDEMVELLGITSLLDRSPAHFSAERQRVAIGRTLLSQPKVLLMDEPLATLDRCAKREILPSLKRLNNKLAVPTIYISHEMAEIELHFDQRDGSWTLLQRHAEARVSRSLSRCARHRRTPHTIEGGFLSRWSIDQRERLDGWVIEQLQTVQGV